MRGILCVSVLLVAVTARAARLDPTTTRAFDDYIQFTGLMAMHSPDGEDGYRARAHSGGVIIHDAGESMEVPGGLIHDWTGTVFAPGVKAIDVVKLLREFDLHGDVYEEVTRSKTLSEGPKTVHGYWRLRKHKGVTVVLNVEMEAHYRQVDPHTWSVASHSVRVAEVRDAGKPNEHEIEPGKGRGFLWRLNAYWWIEEASDGVYVRCRTISLTRKPPTGLGWLIRPMIDEAPRESLVSTLKGTRAALTGEIHVAALRHGD